MQRDGRLDAFDQVFVVRTAPPFLDPILDSEARHSSKFSRVVRDKFHAKAECVGGDQQIHGSNRCAFLFKSRTEPAIGRCGFSIKRGDIERGDKLIEGDAILCGVPALACPVLEFRHGDAGDSDVTNWMCEEAFEYGGRVMLDEVDADIGIQH